MLRRWRHRVVGIEIPTLQSPMSRKFENKLARVAMHKFSRAVERLSKYGTGDDGGL